MSTRIQRTNNKINTAAVAIGYTPNKSSFSSLTGSQVGINLDTSLSVESLTAKTNFRSETIFANSIVANSITTVSTLTGVNEGTFFKILTAADVEVNNIFIKGYVAGNNRKIIPGEKIFCPGTIDFAFSYKNKFYIFSHDNQLFLKPVLLIYDTYNIDNPTFILSSYNIAQPIETTHHQVNKDTNYLYYTALNQNTNQQEIYAYNLNTNSAPLSTAKTTFSLGTVIKNIFIKDNFLYAQLDNPSNLQIFNINNPSTITFAGSCNLFGREVFEVLENYTLTNNTILTGGVYQETIGVIDTLNKNTPFYVNEVLFNNVGLSSTNPKIYQNYVYRTYDDISLSASKLFFYNIYEFLRQPFRPTLTHTTSSILPGYENIGDKVFDNDILYINSLGKEGFSVWNFSNIFSPVSSYFWNDTESIIDSNNFIDSNEGTFLLTGSGLTALQPFHTYSANFDGLKASHVNSDAFTTYDFKTENIEFINSVGINLSASNVISNDVLPVLPVPKIILKGSSILSFGSNELPQNPIIPGGTFTLLRSPHLLVEDITRETLSKHKVFLEIIIFRRRKKQNHLSHSSYTYTSPAPLGTAAWQEQGFLNRCGDADNPGRTNYIPITSIRPKEHIDLSPLLNLHLREKNVNYLPLSAQFINDYNTVPLLCPFGSNGKNLSQTNPRYPYARRYRPLYVAFRYLAWLPNANNGTGQIISGPLSPVLRIANKIFPFHIDHYESSIKGFPVASLSPHYVNNFIGMKTTFTCNFC